MKDLFRHIPTSQNPKVRNGDPEAWNCLTDEQRDVIDMWYQNVCREDYEKQKKEEANRDNIYGWKVICGLVPFATWYCEKRHLSMFWEYASSFAVILIFQIFVFVLFSRIAEAVDFKADGLWAKFIAIAGAWFATACIITLLESHGFVF